MTLSFFTNIPSARQRILVNVYVLCAKRAVFNYEDHASNAPKEPCTSHHYDETYIAS